MSGSWWLLPVFVLAGAGNWLIEYRAQRRPGPRLLDFYAPSWMATLCGDPSGDGRIDLERGVSQLTSLIFVFGAPLSLLLPLDTTFRVGLLFLIYALVAMPCFALVEWLRRKVEEEQQATHSTPACRGRHTTAAR